MLPLSLSHHLTRHANGPSVWKNWHSEQIRMHTKYLTFLHAFALTAYACNKHITDFRLYGGTDCFTINLGVWTVIEGDFRSNECNSLRTNEIGEVQSMMLVDICESCDRKSVAPLV